MTIAKWIMNREDDNFIIEDDDGTIVYDARKTNRDPALYILNSLVTDIYTWNSVTVLSI